MIFKYCYCYLLLRSASVHEEKDDGERLEARVWWPSRQLRVSTLAAFQLCRPFPSCECALVVLLQPLILSGHVNASSSSVVETPAPGAVLLQLFRNCMSFLVLLPSTRSPQFRLTTGNVTMEDTKIVHDSGPLKATGPGHGLESSIISVSEESNKECSELDRAKVSPHESDIAASCKPVTEASPDLSRARLDDCEATSVGVEGGGSGELSAISRRKGVSTDLTVAEGGSDGIVVVDDCRSGDAAEGSAAQPERDEFEALVFEGTEEDSKEEPESSWVTDGLENGKLGSSTSNADAPCKTETLTDGDNFSFRAEATFMGVLEKLVSLDPSEIFKDPVDDSFAPNYSKVIKTPMCFSMMQEKISTHQYLSWRLFVEDFERICYNAMKYNQKRSKIWNAASALLRQGKKIIEPYSELGDNHVSASNTAENIVSSQDVSKGGSVELVQQGSVGSKQGHSSKSQLVSRQPNCEIIEVPVIMRPLEDLDLRSSLGGECGKHGIDQGTLGAISGNDTLSNHERTDIIGREFKGIRANHVDEDVKVEILECTGAEDLRLDSRDEATECSSSFGYTESKEQSDAANDVHQQNAEVESELRDGNGALASAFAEDDEIVGGNERSKKALNAEWKKYRRGIEWRCRWLEVRLNELRARSEKYDRILEERRAKKAWIADMQPGEGSSARTVQIKDIPIKGQPILRRRRRKQVESSVDLDAYMARHPLFSRYDKKKKRDDIYVEAKVDSNQQIQSQQNFVEMERRVPEESDTEEQVAAPRPSVGGQDSMEQILWKVEALQARVEKMKHQMNTGAPPKNLAQPTSTPKVPSNLPRVPTQAAPRISVPSAAVRTPGTKGRPPAGQSPGFSGIPSSANGGLQKQVTAPMRRRSSDYDINNMVMPVNVGAKYVEHIKHADIWTPHWRLVDGSEATYQAIDGSSSDEDTDDEQFVNRHSEMEVIERQQRYMLPPKRSPDGEPVVSGKGRSKAGMGKGAGKMSARVTSTGPTKAVPVVIPAVESPEAVHSPAFAGIVPKGKRRKRLFNATAFTSNHAQRLAAYLADSPMSFGTPDVDDSTIGEDIDEISSVQPLLVGDRDGTLIVPSVTSEQGDLRKKRSTSTGLQVLANP